MSAQRKWSTEESLQALDMYASETFTYADIGKALGGISATAARSRVRRLLDNPPTEDNDYASATATSVAELMAEHGLDPAVWSADRVSLTGGRIWARFTPLVDPDDVSVMGDLREDMRQHAPDYSDALRQESSPTRDEDYMLEIDLFDHHFASLVWGDETMGPHNDLSLAEKRWDRAFAHLLAVSEIFPVGQILLPLGNDLVHYEPGTQDSGSGAQTVAGTLLDPDTRYKKVYRKVRQILVRAIEMSATVAPVKVIIVPGNHAGNTEFTMGDSLECWFHGHPTVEIDNTPPVRKYIRFGNNLLGFTHGHGEKHADLPQIMAEEAATYCGPGAWEGTEFREWHIGHRHRAKQTRHQPVEDLKGVLIRELPSLTPVDAWHFFRGFVGSRKGATAFAWHPERGPEGVFSFNALAGDE